MPTLREQLTADLDAARATATAATSKVAEIEQKLQQTEGGFVAMLDTDVERVKEFFRAFATHLGFAAPAAPTEEPPAA